MSVFDQNEQYFYVGGYSSAQEMGIHLCALNPSSGKLRLVHSASGIENPSFLIVGGRSDGLQLFAAMECEEGRVAAYHIEPADGRLTLLHTESTDGASPCHVSLAPSGHLLVANYSSGHVNSFELDEQGGAGRKDCYRSACWEWLSPRPPGISSCPSCLPIQGWQVRLRIRSRS